MNDVRDTVPDDAFPAHLPGPPPAHRADVRGTGSDLIEPRRCSVSTSRHRSPSPDLRPRPSRVAGRNSSDLEPPASSLSPSRLSVVDFPCSLYEAARTHRPLGSSRRTRRKSRCVGLDLRHRRVSGGGVGGSHAQGKKDGKTGSRRALRARADRGGGQRGHPFLQEPVLGAADGERRDRSGVRGVLPAVPEASMSAAVRPRPASSTRGNWNGDAEPGACRCAAASS